MLNEKMIMTGSNVVMWEVKGIKTQRTPEKDLVGMCSDDTESLDLSQKDAQSMNKRRIIKGATARLTHVHLEKWPLNVCVCLDLTL